MKSSNRITSFFTSKRRWIQLLAGAGMFAAVFYLHISLLYVLGVGALAGIIFGKVFCRWICPMGFIKELLTGSVPDEDKFIQTYQYHKMGCPIAWVSGFLNRFSLFRIKLDRDSCKNCGVCDRACYLSTLESETYSLYKEDKKIPGEAFACSKCLKCVEACPSGCLSYSPGR